MATEEYQQPNEEESYKAKYKSLKSEHELLALKHFRLKSQIRIVEKSLTSFGLARRLREWRATSSTDNPLPSPQTENLIASVLNRVLIGTLLAIVTCLLYTSPSPRDRTRSRMPSSA